MWMTWQVHTIGLTLQIDIRRRWNITMSLWFNARMALVSVYIYRVREANASWSDSMKRQICDLMLWDVLRNRGHQYRFGKFNTNLTKESYTEFRQLQSYLWLSLSSIQHVSNFYEIPSRCIWHEFQCMNFILWFEAELKKIWSSNLLKIITDG